MKVTMEYVARLAGVSKATVSRVLNGKAEGVGPATRRRVERILKETGYSLSPLPSFGAGSRIVGLVLPNLANPFFGEMAQAVSDAADRAGYTVIACDTGARDAREDRCLAALTAARVDGVILATSHSAQQHLSRWLEKYSVPCVLADRHLREDGVTSGVFVDNEYAFFRAAELLIGHGSRRILFLRGERGLSTSCERCEGYVSALRQYGIPFDPALIADGGYSFSGGYGAVRGALVRSVCFDAVLAANDMMAFGALRALREAGIRVPRDVEVMGFDNIDFSAVTEPALSTMEQPVRELGRTALGMLIRLMEHPDAPRQWVRLETRLFERGTTRHRA